MRKAIAISIATADVTQIADDSVFETLQILYNIYNSADGYFGGETLKKPIEERAAMLTRRLADMDPQTIMTPPEIITEACSSEIDDAPALATAK